MEILERIIISSYPESLERDQGGSTKTDKSDSGGKADVQKPSDVSIPQDDLVVMKTTDTGSANLADSDAIPISANVLKETPKSSVKPLKGGRTRSSVKKRSISLSFSREKAKETIIEEKDINELVSSVESKRGRRTPIRKKTPVTPSMQEAITQTPKSEMKESSDVVQRNFPGSLEASSAVLYGSHLRPGMLNIYLLECLEHDQLIPSPNKLTSWFFLRI
jgi:predicted nucleic acid-binding protein